MQHYSDEELISRALKAIDEEDCTTIDEVCMYLPISRQTFYNRGFDKLDELKEAIIVKKVQLKKKMRRNWRNSDNATLQIADFKLMACDDELEKLTINKVKSETDLSIKGKPTISIDFENGSGS